MEKNSLLKIIVITITLLAEIIYELNDTLEGSTKFNKTKIDPYNNKPLENCEKIPVLTYHRIVNDWEKKSYI